MARHRPRSPMSAPPIRRWPSGWRRACRSRTSTSSGATGWSGCGRSWPSAISPGLLLCDPLNIRYATDVANMQVWCLHNLTRCAFVATEGPVVLYDYAQATHLAANFPLVDEVRPATAWFYMYAGSAAEEERRVRAWAREIAESGGRPRRRQPAARHRQVRDVRHRGAAGGGGAADRRPGAVRGGAQDQARRGAQGHAPRRARLRGRAWPKCGATSSRASPRTSSGPSCTRPTSPAAASGSRPACWPRDPRTNPWFHECSDRVIEAGDMVAFDTDLIGPYGYCADISRSWVTPGRRPTPQQSDTHALALEHIEHNLAVLRPGLTFHEFIDRSYRVGSEHEAPPLRSGRPRRRVCATSIPPSTTRSTRPPPTTACSSPAWCCASRR